MYSLISDQARHSCISQQATPPYSLAFVARRTWTRAANILPRSKRIEYPYWWKKKRIMLYLLAINSRCYCGFSGGWERRGRGINSWECFSSVLSIGIWTTSMGSGLNYGGWSYEGSKDQQKSPVSQNGRASPCQEARVWSTGCWGEAVWGRAISLFRTVMIRRKRTAGWFT